MQYLLNYMIIKLDNDTKLLEIQIIDSRKYDSIIINKIEIKDKKEIAREEEI